ncbi:MAG: hypothetical protein CMJ34_05365 [Phycisphaerae bacterium]|nr:hypothetical protein [Phycisphaerae bacterium]
MIVTPPRIRRERSMNHRSNRLRVLSFGMAVGMVAPVLSADVMLEYELTFNGVTGSLGDTSFQNETMTITIPGSVGSIYEEDGHYNLDCPTRWQYGPTDATISIGGGVITDGELGGSNLRVSTFDTETPGETRLSLDVYYTADLQPSRWHQLMYFITDEGGGAFNMLSSEMSIGGDWVVLQYWDTYFTQNIGWVNGQDLQLDFGTGNDASWNVTLASSGENPVPGIGGIAAMATAGLLRRRRR